MTTERYKRKTHTHVFLNIAKDLAMLSTCVSRQVGCVLVDKFNRIIGSGYNGVASRVDHYCLDHGCMRGACHNAGENLAVCPAIHAEANALMHCFDIKKIASIYISGASPCFECAKLICNSGASIVICDKLYSSHHVNLTTNIFIARNINLAVYSYETNNVEKIV